jgi:hypothetical protein
MLHDSFYNAVFTHTLFNDGDGGLLLTLTTPNSHKSLFGKFSLENGSQIKTLLRFGGGGASYRRIDVYFLRTSLELYIAR